MDVTTCGKYSNSPSAKKNAKMSRWIFASIVACAIIFLGFQTYVYADKVLQSRETWGPKESTIVISNLQFSLDLYTHMTDENQKKNIFFSPFSISVALGMILLGSSGNTSQQITKAFSLDENVSCDDLHGTFKFLMKELISNEHSEHVLNIANKLFIHRELTVMEDYQGECILFYDAKATRLDFLSETEPSRKFINQWVSDVTQNKIPELLKIGIISSDTRLVIANGAYFKGNWSSKFNKDDTISRHFFVSETEKIKQNVMHQEGKFPVGFIQQLNSHVLRMSYSGNELSMIIILPVDTMGIFEVEKKLTPEIIMSLGANMKKTKINIYLPKFKLNQHQSIAPTLSKMGIRDLFDDHVADLSRISGKRDLFVDHVVHQAFIDVTEDGSEAAAATAASIATMSAVQDKLMFKADHPFIFYIQHEKTGVILFLGRYMGERTEPRSEL